MVHAAGRLYVSNEAGTTFVIEPTPEAFKLLAENKVGELTRASLAFSDGQIFLRTLTHLYCIGEHKKESGASSGSGSRRMAGGFG